MESHPTRAFLFVLVRELKCFPSPPSSKERRVCHRAVGRTSCALACPRHHAQVHAGIVCCEEGIAVPAPLSADEDINEGNKERRERKRRDSGTGGTGHADPTDGEMGVRDDGGWLWTLGLYGEDDERCGRILKWKARSSAARVRPSHQTGYASDILFERAVSGLGLKGEAQHSL
ncbi:hypothetical protein DPEC_G00242710 [Dallia pectoralis]|uniref:Uncharacterized protein n=1 Tax=Dallia pectoralis TaxID=75939 RepID=A0ACC2FV73_DALPE|nr:hypothetical protein DPEC_G00242710 [Dallia pectoralis]